MGGGGFMTHAVDTNKKDRAQRATRREKFKGNHSEKTLMGSDTVTQFDFSSLSKEQIRIERKRISALFKVRNRKKAAIITVSVVILTGVFMTCYFLIFGT